MKKLLFFGDSITDGQRNYMNRDDLGVGYVKRIAECLVHSEKVINRGVNGERMRELLARIEGDVLLEKPDVVTLFIGINDTWRKFDSGDETMLSEFEKGYRELIERMRDAGIFVILVSPYLLEIDDVFYTWRSDLDPKIAMIEQLAYEYGCLFIPLDSIMQGYANVFGKAELAYDGVHPSEKGKEIIATTWLSYYRNLESN